MFTRSRQHNISQRLATDRGLGEPLLHDRLCSEVDGMWRASNKSLCLIAFLKVAWKLSPLNQDAAQWIITHCDIISGAMWCFLCVSCVWSVKPCMMISIRRTVGSGQCIHVEPLMLCLAPPTAHHHYVGLTCSMTATQPQSKSFQFISTNEKQVFKPTSQSQHWFWGVASISQ